jgi:hypothetical protein
MFEPLPLLPPSPAQRAPVPARRGLIDVFEVAGGARRAAG